MRVSARGAVLVALVCQVGSATVWAQAAADALAEVRLLSDMQAEVSLPVRILEDGDVGWLRYPLRAYQVAAVEPSRLRLLRNAIFAAHGYIFSTPDLKEFFTKFAWYKPTSSQIPQDLTATEIYNVELIQYFEKAIAAQGDRPLAGDLLTGMWHELPMVPSGWMDRYYLYSDGKFKFATNQMDSTRRILSLAGTWRLDRGILVARVVSKAFVSGGELSPSRIGSGYEILGGKVQTTAIDPAVELRFPLSSYIAADNMSGKLSYSLPALVIGATKYWKMYDNPNDATE